MAVNTADIHKLAIHPAIGITRVGNAPIDDYYLGPERPGVPSSPAEGGKNSAGQIRRQAARFRIYAYNASGQVLGELTAADGAVVHWTVHVANSKAASPTTSPNSDEPPPRNHAVTGADRAGLVIDPGPRTITGTSGHAVFDSGQFRYPGFAPVSVDLGGMYTDDQGRLIVVPGPGVSSSPDSSAGIDDFYNNPKWYDDVCDGPVTATVEIGGRTLAAEGAWVVAGPPDYAGHIDTVLSLHDHLIAKHWPPAPGQPGNGGRPSYVKHVYPILARAAGYKWVRGSQEPAALDLSTAHSADRQTRKKIAEQIPRLPGSVSAQQRNVLEMWVSDDFDRDGDRPPPPPITAEGLDRAALEACVGARFYPGIEAGVWVDDPQNFSSRLRVKGKPGDFSQRMAVPWQADFYECGSDDWWPAQRPNKVVTGAGGERESWARGVSTKREMVDKWSALGFVVPDGQRQVEVQRGELSVRSSQELHERIASLGMEPAKWLPVVELMSELGVKPDPEAPAAQVRIAGHLQAIVEDILGGQ